VGLSVLLKFGFLFPRLFNMVLRLFTVSKCSIVRPARGLPPFPELEVNVLGESSQLTDYTRDGTLIWRFGCFYFKPQ